MNLVSIDRTLCKRDGHCAAVCLRGLFDTDGEGFPVFREDAAESCIACGHCVAVCPNDALRHEQLPATDAPLIAPGLTPSAAATDQLLKGRRSIREFRKEPVPDGLIAEAVDAARWAPSAVNRQPVHWLVIRSAAEVRRLAGLVADSFRQNEEIGKLYSSIVEQWDRGKDLILRDAPQLVVVHGAEDWRWSMADCIIALTQFELAAVARGIGACWAGFLIWASHEYPPLKEALAIPEGHEVYGALMVGWPRYRYHRSPPRMEARIVWR